MMAEPLSLWPRVIAATRRGVVGLGAIPLSFILGRVGGLSAQLRIFRHGRSECGLIWIGWGKCKRTSVCDTRHRRPRRAAGQFVIVLDAAHDPIHGEQEKRHFSGCYRCGH